MKKIFRLIIVLIFIYSIFMVEESIRLSNNMEAKPLIIINEIKVNEMVIYESVGFKLINKYGYIDNNDERTCLGQEVWLFNIIMLWGWIT